MKTNSVDEVLMKEMEFTHGDRTFTCRAEGSAASPGTLWWWITVSGESSRYAAFRAEAGDTARSLQPRIIAYYEELLAARARPAVTRSHWSQKRQAQAPANPAGDAPSTE
jgi:hypothetical protein